MKILQLIVAASLVALLGLGLGYVAAVRAVSGTPPAAEVERAVAADLLATGAGIARLAVTAGDELLAPGAALPASHRHDPAEIGRLYLYAKGCDSSMARAPNDASLSKALRWAAFRCGHAAAPSAEYFRAVPYMHPGGQSYVALALASGAAEFRDGEWIAAHRAYLHVLERARWRPVTGPLSLVDEILADLSRADLAAFVGGRSPIIGRANVLVRTPAASAVAAPGDYQAYPRTLWDARLAARHPASPRLLRGLEVAAAGAAMLLVVALAGLAVLRLREQRRTHAREVHLVRTLTHELRTPATSLALTLETLRGEFDALPPAAQDAFLLMCEQVQRLSRVVAGSARYLRASTPPNAARGAVSTAPTVRDFCERVLGPYEERIEWSVAVPDRPLPIDANLLEVCVRNLIDNALRHGRPAVRVRVGQGVAASLCIEVEDQGELPTADLDRLPCPEPVSSTDATPAAGIGLGLGLAIVRRIARDLGGQLTMAPRPTTFILTFRGAP